MIMAGKTIGQLTALDSLSGQEEIPVEVNGANKKIKTELLATKKDLGDIATILDEINGEVV